MRDKYDSIRNLTRPVYPDLPHMPVEDRAAQFSPFAAVVGYDDAVDETARLTDARILLGEDEAARIDEALADIRRRLPEGVRANVTYFVPDERKAGGRYENVRGKVRRIDDYEKVLILEGNLEIDIGDIIKIELEASKV